MEKELDDFQVKRWKWRVQSQKKCLFKVLLPPFETFPCGMTFCTEKSGRMPYVEDDFYNKLITKQLKNI